MGNRILIVEEEDYLRQAYQTTLEAEGYDVVTAEDEADALERIVHEPVDLVVLDLVHTAGSEPLKLQQILEYKRDVKLVISSGYGSHIWDFRSWAADVFLSKSSDLNELKNTIAELLLRN